MKQVREANSVRGDRLSEAATVANIERQLSREELVDASDGEGHLMPEIISAPGCTEFTSKGQQSLAQIRLSVQGQHTRVIRSLSNGRKSSNNRVSNVMSGSFSAKNDGIKSIGNILQNFTGFKIEGVKHKHLQALYEAKCKDLQIKASKD